MVFDLVLVESPHHASMANQIDNVHGKRTLLKTADERATCLLFRFVLDTLRNQGSCSECCPAIRAEYAPSISDSAAPAASCFNRL